TLMDVILCRNAAELRAIADQYEHQYHRNMREDILSEFSGKLKRVFIAALSMGREAGPADMSRVNEDVQALRKATKGLGTDEAAVYQILFSRSMLHLRAVFTAFTQAFGKSVRDIMKSEFSGKVCTNDSRLVACLATRYDICGFGRIAAAYDLKYGGAGKCAKDIKGDLSGNYEKLALALLHIQ
ncbi:hypothetical protein KIPB_005165, partial [Kipferlia bialata]